MDAVQTLASAGGWRPTTAALSRRYGLDPEAGLDPAATPAERLDRVRQLAGELESVFLTVLLGAMRRTAGRNSLVGNSAGERTFAPFLDAERARAIAERGGLGVADALVAQIGRRYAEAAAAPARVRPVIDAEG